MIPLIILALAAFLFLLFLLFQVWSRYSYPGEGTPGPQLTTIDLDAFENLTDPEEEGYLRLQLSPAAFRKAQRLRIRAAKLYVATLSRNAGMMVAVGQSVRRHPEAEIAASGQELMQRAIQLKVWCMLSSVRLNVAFLFPGLLSPSNAIASRYLTVKYMAASLSSKLAA
ncbi:MAG: hypothetical protein WAL71_16685 [Terriglobales bacterium]|jgi:hypothetical protein